MRGTVPESKAYSMLHSASVMCILVPLEHCNGSSRGGYGIRYVLIAINTSRTSPSVNSQQRRPVRVAFASAIICTLHSNVLRAPAACHFNIPVSIAVDSPVYLTWPSTQRNILWKFLTLFICLCQYSYPPCSRINPITLGSHVDFLTVPMISTRVKAHSR